VISFNTCHPERFRDEFHNYAQYKSTLLYSFLFTKTVEKKNNTKTIKSERKANNLTKHLGQKLFCSKISGRAGPLID